MKKGLFQVLIANLIFMLIGLVSNFILPKYLSVDSYSMIKTYALYISYAGLFHLGYSDGMYIKYGGKNLWNIDKRDIGTNFLNYIVLLTFVSIALAMAGLLAKNTVVCFFSIGVFATNCISYFRSMSQAVGEYSLYGKTLNYERILALVGYIILIFIFGEDNYRAFLGVQVIASISIAIVLCVYLVHKVKFWGQWTISLLEIKKNIQQGIVLMLGNFSSALFTGMDRWFVKILMSNSAFAHYSFAVSMEQIINVFITPITVSMYNYFCRNHDCKGIARVKNCVMMWGMVIVFFAFPLKFFVEMFLPQYTNATGLVFILFAAHAFYVVIKGIYVNYYKSIKRQDIYFKQLCIMVCIAFVSNVIAYFAFRTTYAIAIATLLTAFLWFILCEKQTKEIRGDWKKSLALIFIVVIYLLCGTKCEVIMGACIYMFLGILVSILFFRDDLRFMHTQIKGLFSEFSRRGC